MIQVDILGFIRDVLDRLIRRESSVFRDASWIESNEAKYTAFILGSLAIIFSLTHIFRHLKHYTMPQIQVYVIRILLICPIYALTSTIALFVGSNALYAETVRDLYEAIVVYSFFNLILEYGGGETDLVYAIENDTPLKLPWPLCCLKARPRNARLLRFCHQGVLQFIIVKPFMAVLDIIFISTSLYSQPAWQIIKMLIYNISYAWALYCLFVFYLAVKKVISQFRPIAKFTTVKMIIFATYYQSLVLQLTLSKPSTAVDWNNLLLVAEMVVFAIAFMIAFPVQEFYGGIPHRRVLQNVKDVFTMRDIFQNIYHNFMPEYRDYALQSNQQEIPSTINEPVRMNGNLSRVAKEMAERYRGRSAKKSFNEILRGGNPITAKLRRRYSANSESALLEEENNSNHSLLGIECACNEIHNLEGTKRSLIISDEVKGDLEGVDIENQVNYNPAINNSSTLGKLPLHIKAKLPSPHNASHTLPSSHQTHRAQKSLSASSSHASLSPVERQEDFATFPQEIQPSSLSSRIGTSDDDDVENCFKSPKVNEKSITVANTASAMLSSPSVEWSDYMEGTQDLNAYLVE